jgi:hypothetical protein
MMTLRLRSLWIGVVAGVCMLGSGPAAAETHEIGWTEAAVNWEPTPWPCTVLSSKFGNFKFITDARGGVSTCFISEVLGDCPLIPTRAPLMAKLHQSAQLVIGTGEPADFRLEQHPGMTQRLLDGDLPIMTTRWRDAAAEIEYDEQIIARNLEGGYAATTGRENGLALLRLQARNLTGEPRTAHLTLAINRSPNGQPHGISSVPYGGALRREGDALLNAEGEVRLAWRAPEGVGEPAVALAAETPPQILEWDASSGNTGAIERPGGREEPPYNREFKIGTQEVHEAYKSFDALPKTWWEPKDFPQGEGARAQGDHGVGLRFAAPQVLRTVRVLHSWDRIPRVAGGFRFEVFDGERWSAVSYTLNGTPQSEIDASTATQARIGMNWTLELDPVECRGFRLLVDEMAPLLPELAAREGAQNKPRVAEIGYVTSADNADSSLRDSKDDHYLGNTVRFDVPLAAHETRALLVALPYLPAQADAMPILKDLDFDRELTQAQAFWRGELARGGSAHDFRAQGAGDLEHECAAHVHHRADRAGAGQGPLADGDRLV